MRTPDCRKSISSVLIVVTLSCLAQRQALANDADSRRLGITMTIPKNGGRALLGVELRPAVSRLLKEVEELYGKSVEAEFTPISKTPEGDDAAGRAVVRDDGTPAVKVDTSVNPKDRERVERIIAHELLHLRLRAKKYPVIFFTGETELMTEVGPYLLEAGNRLRNGIEHWMFTAEMRAMGFDPGAEVKRGAEKIRQAASEGKGDDVLLALYYYRAVLEYGDPALLAKLRQGYVDGGRLGPIVLGEKLAQVVLNNRPRTPDDVAKTLLVCLDALFQKQIVFTTLPPTEKVSGAVALSRINLKVTRGRP